jgi:hypothetical protein
MTTDTDTPDLLVIKRELRCRSYHLLQIEVIGETGVTAHLEFTEAPWGGFNFQRKDLADRAEDWGTFTAAEILAWRVANRVASDTVISHAVNEPCDLAIARKYAPECFTAGPKS